MTTSTIEKIRRWNRAARQVMNAQEALRAAEAEMASAQNDLGRWLVPGDVVKGEEFNVWIGDGIIMAKQNLAPGSSADDFLVRWRQAPSPKVAAEMALG